MDDGKRKAKGRAAEEKLKYEKWPYKYKAKNGYWYANYIDASGNRHHKESLKTRDELQAQKKFLALLENADRGVLGFARRPQNLPFRDAIARYLIEGTQDLSPASLARHKQSYEVHLIPHFKKLSLKAIGPKEVLNYIRKRQQSAAPNTILKELAALSSLFNFYVEDEVLVQNPVLAVRKPKLRLVRPNYVPTLHEVLKIRQHLAPQAERFFLALVNSGCRVAEIRNANVEDVDLDNGTLRVCRKGGRHDLIPLNDTLRDVIKAEFAKRKWRKGDPLFLNPYGERYQKIRAALKAACRKAKVPYTTHHGLRHAYATILHESGKDIGTISKILGHANPTITQNIYIHWRDAEVENAVRSVNIGEMEKKLKTPEEGQAARK